MRRVAGAAAGAILLMGVALVATIVVLALHELGASPVPMNGGATGTGLAAALGVATPPLAFVVVGAILVARLPRNPIGWALSGYGLNFAGTVAAESYWALSWSQGGGRWGTEVAAWFATWNWALGLVLLALALMYFPTGRLPSTGWRWVRWVVALLTLSILVAWVSVWSVRHDPSLLEHTSGFPPLTSAIQPFAEPGAMLLVFVGLVSLIVRFRRSGHVERSQLKWLFYAVACAAAGLGIFLVTGSGPGRDAPEAAELLTLVGLTGIPAAIGIAVTRYRLYEIDRIISRTVSYALVTAILVGVYVGGVLGIGALARALTGESGDLVVALSTLLVAAFFAPVRRRVQVVVDRRFNRSHADAWRAADHFGRRLREHIEIEGLSRELEGLVARTLEPSWANVTLTRGAWS
ncbi:MAG: hypothetical protein R3320_12945 [Nitriliruptorales bacterium]|nr:hypothetical protein [Nitriliruptorales bacterium]